jgi:apolipoprotein N-acyltransferase
MVMCSFKKIRCFKSMSFSFSYPARCTVALVSGAVYAMAYPPVSGSEWMVIPGIAGLLISLQGQVGTRVRTLGFIHGLVAYGVSLSWLFQIFGGVSVVLWFVLAAFTALFAEFQSRAQTRGINGWKLVVFTSLNWCGWEFIRSELFPLKFPWMTAGLAIGPNRLLPWVGVYGVSAVVICGVALLVARSRAVILIPLVALLAGFGLMSPVSNPNPADPMAVKVGGLQFENVSLTDFLNETRKLPTDLKQVVWPEYAVPYDLQANKRDWKLVRDLCKKRDITLTLGTQSRPATGDTWRNIALTLDPNGVLGTHTKVHTVHLFDDGLAGSTADPVQTSHGKIGTPICFDCDYEGIVRRMTSGGAEMFIVPMMDAEKWTARQHDQHAELFRIRACENGRWMFVCGTSGVSQIIDPNGVVHAQLGALKAGPLTGIMRRETKLTPYTKLGWLTPWVILGMAGIAWTYLLCPVSMRSRFI